MGRKQKVLLGSSLLLNACLIIILIIGYLKMNLVHEALFYSEVQSKLVELDGLIEHQKNHNWSEPNLVTTQLGDVLNGMDAAMNSAKYSGWISNEEKMVMEHLDAALRQYPHDELYQFSVLTQSDKDSFNDLQSNLQTAGFGMNMTISNDWKSFISKSKKLLDFLQ
ncbi:hypothetical protein J2S09_004341 [Bacillus fengqiuensis]|nr:hypothetical protein [Bacillus fengqiuensis]